LDTVDNVATIIGIARDVVLFLLLAVALIGALAIFRKVTSLLNTVKRAADQAQQLTDMLSRTLVDPAASNPRITRAIGRAIGWFTNRRRSGGRDDGE
jgi:hypothetical protein